MCTSLLFTLSPPAGLVGCLVCTVLFVCSWFTCTRATYTDVFGQVHQSLYFNWAVYDHAPYAVVATCRSDAGDRCRLFQLCVICRRNTLMFYLAGAKNIGRYMPDISEVSSVSAVRYLPA